MTFAISGKKKDVNKGYWSLEEDQKLVSYINKYGSWNWSQMPRFAGLSRSGKSCRLRWLNYLKPNVKRGNFSKEEDEIILLSHSLLGNRWSAIASRLPGRTDNDVKNYWHTHLKKRATKQKRASKQNSVHDTSDQNHINSPPTVNAYNLDKLQKPDNHTDNVFESHFTFQYDSSSSTCTTSFKDHEVELRTKYYDHTCSPGTVDDLQYLWDQLCPVENVDLGNSHRNMPSDSVFQELYNYSVGPYSFCNNDYNNSTTILPDP